MFGFFVGIAIAFFAAPAVYAAQAELNSFGLPLAGVIEQVLRPICRE